jgi:hypothetical protein
MAFTPALSRQVAVDEEALAVAGPGCEKLGDFIGAEASTLHGARDWPIPTRGAARQGRPRPAGARGSFVDGARRACGPSGGHRRR